jgi:uncharacterized protein YkwD
MSIFLIRRQRVVILVFVLLVAMVVTTGWTAPDNPGASALQDESPTEDNYIYLPLILNNPISGPQPAGCMSSEEALLANMVNDYRNDNGLADVPVSKSLVTVAQWHVLDLNLNHPDSGVDPRGLACNLHSWSDWHPSLWTAVCYTIDHYYATGMWIKPSEITDNAYTGNGYENAYWTSGQATAADALSGWQISQGHREVILEQGIWSGAHWPAMGVGIYEHYAVLWFGDASDPQGSVGECTP